MRNFKVGDSVTINEQIGQVISTDGPAPYSIEVSFENGTEDCFTLEGLQHVQELQERLTHAHASLAMLAATLVITIACTLSVADQSFQYKRAYERSIEKAESIARTKTGAINDAFTCRLIGSVPEAN